MFKMQLSYNPKDLFLRKIHETIDMSTTVIDCELAATSLLCRSISKYNFIKFSVVGFGQNWEFDIYSDLASVIPEIPEVIGSLPTQEIYPIVFSSQGTDLLISFKHIGNNIIISCNDLINDQKIGSPEKATFEGVSRALSSFACSFLKISETVHPQICGDKYFQSWRSSLLNATKLCGFEEALDS